MEARGILGSVAFDGQWVTIEKRGTGQAMKGARRVSVGQITSVTFKSATALYHGYIQFTVAGAPAAAVVRSGWRRGGRLARTVTRCLFRRRRTATSSSSGRPWSQLLKAQAGVRAWMLPTSSAGSLICGQGVLTDSEFEAHKARLLNP